MSRIIQFSKTHWKKLGLASVSVLFGANYIWNEYRIYNHMRSVCKAASQSSSFPKAVNVLVVLNPVANKKRSEKMDLLSQIALDKLDIIEDARIDTNTNKKKRDAWNTIHALFNKVSPNKRSLEQIQNQWRKTKSVAKTKNSAFIKQATGGGPAPKPLDSIEEELVSRLPKHFQIDCNMYDSNSQLIEICSETIQLDETIKTDNEMFNIEDEEVKNPIVFKRKKSKKIEVENENSKRIKLLDLSIKQKEMEMKCLEENHLIQKRRNERLDMQEKEEHKLKIEKIKLEIEILKKKGFFD